MPALLIWFALLLAAAPAPAQDADDASASQPLMLVNQREAEALRRTLAAAVPPGATADALGRHFTDKDMAAERLGDKRERERVLREAIEHLPTDPRWPNNLAVVLKSQARWDESRKFHEMAIERARHPTDRLFYESNLMRLQQERGADDAAARAAQVRRDGEALLAGLKASNERVSVLRALGSAAGVEAILHSRRGEFNDALAAAAESERWNREALDTAQALPGSSAAILMRSASGLAIAQRERAAALGRLGRFAEMQAVLSEHLQLIQRYPIDASFAAGAHQSMASLHIQRREFAQAERQLRLALQVLDSLGTPKTAPSRVSKVADLVLTLWARGMYAQARREIDTLDEQARRDKTPPARVRMAYERGLVDLMTGRAAQAAALFSDVARRNLARYGEGHYFVANARGLQGVALWMDGKPGQSEAAAELLRQAVFDHQLPRNADFLTDAALRKVTRELIFSTYLEAMARRGGLQALLALGVADRLLDGVTAQAMADAAVRSSTHNAALAALVRQEQDLRNELHALQQVLQSGSEQDALSEPDAARARRRMSELELTRQQVQERIRGRFPGYDRLVRPALPSATDVAQRLGRDEALLLAVPTDKALYVWAMTADELPTFARVDVSLAKLQALVNRVRRSVEFTPGRGRLPPFDAQAAHELYQFVLAPVAASLQGRRHLIVASAGPLAVIPFATLLAAPPAGQLADWAWLARQMAISHVPSVSAWLSLRQMPHGQSAPEPLIAWGDPAFSLVSAAKVAGHSNARDLTLTRSSATATIQYTELPPLPETRVEILAIAASLKADQRDLLLGALATRESVIEANRSGALAKKRVIVFATHGLMAGDLPGLEQPALAMAATAGDSDPLAALIGLDDVLSLRLNADWVVLSACNTASADGKAVEALSGLARGFLYAGSRSLLVTHWPVETESAKRITAGTFQFHVSNARSSKAESLRQSMLRVLATPEYSHPAFWAPYVLVGDGAR